MGERSFLVSPNRLLAFGGRNRRRIGGVAIAAGIVFPLAACSDDGPKERPTSSVNTEADSPSASPTAVAEQELHSGGRINLDPHREVTNTMSGLDCDTSDIPQIPEGLVLVDGRCDAQGQDIPVGLHQEPNQSSDGLAVVSNGAILELTEEACRAAGENIVNSDGVGSTDWIEVELDNPQIKSKTANVPTSAYIPGAWVHGDENLDPC